MEPTHARLTDHAPPHCSGCFQQKPTMRHVDMGAAWDGPTLPALKGAVGVVGHVIEDLVLCEDCIRNAAKLVGLVEPGAVVAERDQLEASNSVLHGKLEAAQAYITTLEKAVAAKPATNPLPSVPAAPGPGKRHPKARAR